MQDNDLISRAAAIDNLTKCPMFYDQYRGKSLYYTGVNAMLKCLPAVDAVPVVHAYWWYDDLDGIWLCSHCNSGESVEQRKYCPYCGAQMDGGEDDGHD